MKEVDNFIQDEFENMSWYEKNYKKPEFENTKVLSTEFTNIKLQVEKTIHPSLLHRIFVILLLLVFICAWIYFVVLLLIGVLIVLDIFFLVFISVLIAFLVWNKFLNRKYNYKIKLNKDNLQIDNSVTLWKNISDTYILRRFGKRGRNSFLVIFKKDGTVNKYSLFNFDISDSKLSTLIESYKR